MFASSFNYDNENFSSQDDVLAYIASEQGWSEAIASDQFAVDDGFAFCAYASQAECDADAEGAYAPRVEVVA